MPAERRPRMLWQSAQVASPGVMPLMSVAAHPASHLPPAAAAGK